MYIPPFVNTHTLYIFLGDFSRGLGNYEGIVGTVP